MLCHKCQQKEATVFVTEVKNKEKTQSQLCEECARAASPSIEQPSFSYSLQSLLGQFLEAVAAKAHDEGTQLKCEHCGLTYHEFRQKGRFGCEHDYDAFAQMIPKLLSHIHGAAAHCGKKPASFQKQELCRERIARLQKRLAQAVQEERYEEAAQIRDEIRILEEKNDGSE